MTAPHHAFRAVPPPEGPERDMLAAWLAFQRETLARACAGLSDEQLRAPLVPSSNLSLLSIVRHMASVERAWFRSPHYRPGMPCSPPPAAGHDTARSLAVWRATCRLATEVEEGIPTLETLDVQRPGRPHSLRWIMMDLIQEYARHNGHADLIRECIQDRGLG